MRRLPLRPPLRRMSRHDWADLLMMVGLFILWLIASFGALTLIGGTHG